MQQQRGSRKSVATWLAALSAILLSSAVAAEEVCEGEGCGNPPLTGLPGISPGNGLESGPIQIDDLKGGVRTSLPAIGPFSPAYYYEPQARKAFPYSTHGTLGGNGWYYGPGVLKVEYRGDGAPGAQAFAGESAVVYGVAGGDEYYRDYVHMNTDNQYAKYPDIQQSVPGGGHWYRVPRIEHNMISHSLSRLALESGGLPWCDRKYLQRNPDGSRVRFVASADCTAKPLDPNNPDQVGEATFLPVLHIAANGAETKYEYELDGNQRPTPRLTKVILSSGVTYSFNWAVFGAQSAISHAYLDRGASRQLLAEFQYLIDSSRGNRPVLWKVLQPDAVAGSSTTTIDYFPSNTWDGPLRVIELDNSITEEPNNRAAANYDLLKSVTSPTGAIARVEYAWGIMPGGMRVHYSCANNWPDYENNRICGTYNQENQVEFSGQMADRDILELRAAKLEYGGAVYRFSVEYGVNDVSNSIPFGDWFTRVSVREVTRNRYQRDSYFLSEDPAYAGVRGAGSRLGRLAYRSQQLMPVGQQLPAASGTAALLPPLPFCSNISRSQVADGFRQFLSCEMWEYTAIYYGNASGIPTWGLGGNAYIGIQKSGPVLKQHLTFKAAPYLDTAAAGPAGVWQRKRFGYDPVNALSTPVTTLTDLVTLDSSGNTVVLASDGLAQVSTMASVGRDRFFFGQPSVSPYRVAMPMRTESCTVKPSTPAGLFDYCADSSIHRKRLISRTDVAYKTFNTYSILPVCETGYADATTTLKTATAYQAFPPFGFLPVASAPVASCAESPENSPYATKVLEYRYGQPHVSSSPAGENPSDRVITTNHFNSVGSIVNTVVTATSSKGNLPKLETVTVRDTLERPTLVRSFGYDAGGRRQVPAEKVTLYPSAADLSSGVLGRRSIRSYTRAPFPAGGPAGYEVVGYTEACADIWGRAVASRAVVAGAARSEASIADIPSAERCQGAGHGYALSTTQYDELGMVASTTAPTGIRSVPVYDVFGGVASSTSYAANSSTVIGYSEAGSGLAIEAGTNAGLTISQSRSGNTVAGAANNQTMSWTYLDGRPQRTLSWQSADRLPVGADGAGGDLAVANIPRVEYSYVDDTIHRTTTTVTPWASRVDGATGIVEVPASHCAGTASSVPNAPACARVSTIDMLGRVHEEKQPEVATSTINVYEPLRGKLKSSLGARGYNFGYDYAGRLSSTFDAGSGDLLTYTEYDMVSGQVTGTSNALDGVTTTTLLDYALRPVSMFHELPAPELPALLTAPGGTVSIDLPVEFRWQNTGAAPATYQLVIYDAANGAVKHVAEVPGTSLAYTIDLSDDLDYGGNYSWTLSAVYPNLTVGDAAVSRFVVSPEGSTQTGGGKIPSTTLTASRTDGNFPIYHHGDTATVELAGSANANMVEQIERRRTFNGVLVSPEWQVNPDLTMTNGAVSYAITVNTTPDPTTPSICGQYVDEYRLAANPAVKSASLSYQIDCSDGLSVQMSAPANGSNYAYQERFSRTFNADCGTQCASKVIEIERLKKVNGEWVPVAVGSGWQSVGLSLDTNGYAFGNFQFEPTSVDCGEMKDNFRIAKMTHLTASVEYSLDCGGQRPVSAMPGAIDLQNIVAGQSITKVVALYPVGMGSEFRVNPATQLTISTAGTHASYFVVELKNRSGGACTTIGQSESLRCFLHITYRAPSQIGAIPSGTEIRVDYNSGSSLIQPQRYTTKVSVVGQVVPAGAAGRFQWEHDDSTFGAGSMAVLDGHTWRVKIYNGDTDPTVTRRFKVIVETPMRLYGDEPYVNPWPNGSTTHQSYNCFLSGGDTRSCSGALIGPKPGTPAGIVTRPVRIMEYVCKLPNATWTQCQEASQMTLVRDQSYDIKLDTWADNYAQVDKRAWVYLLGVKGTAADPVVMPDTVLGDQAFVPMPLQANIHYDSPNVQVIGEGDFSNADTYLGRVAEEGITRVHYIGFGVNDYTGARLWAVPKVGPLAGRICLEPTSTPNGRGNWDWYNPTVNPHDRPCYEVRGNGKPRAVIEPLPGGATQFPATTQGSYRKLPFKITNFSKRQIFNGRLTIAPPFRFVVSSVTESGGISETLVGSVDFRLLGQWHPGQPPNHFDFEVALDARGGQASEGGPVTYPAPGDVSAAIKATVCVVNDPEDCVQYPGEKVELNVTGTVMEASTTGGSSRPSSYVTNPVNVTYDNFGRVKSTSSPITGIVQTLGYDASGAAVSTGIKESSTTTTEQPLSAVELTDSIGRPLKYRYHAGSPAFAWRSYDSAGRINGDALTSTAAGSSPLSGTSPCPLSSNTWYCSSSYRYDDRGFITEMRRNDGGIEANVTGANIKWGYSEQGQLTRFTVNDHSEHYRYDLRGNLEKRTGLSINTLRPKVSLNLPETDNFSYDVRNQVPGWGYNNAGEVTHDRREGVARRYDYDKLGRVKLVREAVASAGSADRIVENYIYDAAGMRVRSRNGKEDTYSFRNGGLIAAERRVDVASGAETKIDFLTINGQAAATRTVLPGGTALTETVTLEFQHNDRLGSPAVKWLTAGALKRSEYSPYGQLMQGARSRTYGYTGHEEDATGLIYMRARYDDPSLGRFTAPDPARDFNAFAPHSFNLYAYTAGNPVNALDPSGMFGVDASGESWENLHKNEEYYKRLIRSHIAAGRRRGLESTNPGLPAVLYRGGLDDDAIAPAPTGVRYWLNRFASWFQSKRKIGMNDDPVVSPADFVPFVGEASDVNDAIKAYDGGRYGSMIVAGALIFVPEGGEALARTAKNVVGDAAADVVEIFVSRSKYPEMADHLEEVVAAGYPSVLTKDSAAAKANRKASLDGIPTLDGYDRDEYPLAMTKEGGAGAHVWYINPSQNRGVGSLTGSALKNYPDGTKFTYVIVE